MWIIENKKTKNRNKKGSECAVRGSTRRHRTRNRRAGGRAKSAEKTRRRGGAGRSGSVLTIFPLDGGARRSVCSSTDCLGGRFSGFRGHKLSAGYRRRMLDAAFSF